MKYTALYPGTFDPITNGHLDIIHRAAQLFDHVIVAIAESRRKTPLIPLTHRIELTKVSIQQPNVSVIKLSGLLVDCAKNNNANIILRGLRSMTDFDYEFQLARMNQEMAPNIETVFLPANEKVNFISGTMIREIIEVGGDASPFVPKAVMHFLKK